MKSDTNKVRFSNKYVGIISYTVFHKARKHQNNNTKLHIFYLFTLLFKSVGLIIYIYIYISFADVFYLLI